MVDRAKILAENKEFFNQYAAGYDKFFGNWIIGTQKRMLRHVVLKKNSRVLDVGCGTGNLLHMLEAKDNRFDLYGIDIAEAMLKIAKGKLKSAHIGVGSAEHIPFKDNFFDILFSVDAFHHYADHEMAMYSFMRKLKKGGQLVIADLNFGFLNGLFHVLEPGNTGLYTKRGLKELLVKHGFKDVVQKKVGLFTLMTVGKK
ncbi:MAG: class I SAM-dependent methyltransferase [Nanoarchaeota archaeon]|nr:class I SAM-dependent methyltransferase [Nanoarchaeota archaeon]